MKFQSYFLISTIFIFCSCSLQNKAQSLLQDNEYDISLNIKLVETDNIQRLYIVTADNTIIHFDNQNSELFRYSNRRRGSITDVNVSNPIKILLYFRDFGNVVLLDNTLAPINEFSLSELGYSDISAVGVSNDDGFWIYDPLRFRLRKILNNGQIIFESANLMDFGIQSLQVFKIIENGNKVIMADRDKGFYFFDNFGQYLRYVSAKNVISFQFDGKFITYFNGKAVMALSTENPFSEPVLVQNFAENQQISDVKISNSEYVIVYSDGLKRLQKK
jgi:hypothetical protein